MLLKKTPFPLRIPVKDYRWPVYDHGDSAEVAKALKLSSHYDYSAVDSFEQEFCRWNGNKYGLALCNGTTGIHAALFALGISPGDEVIVTSLSFWASSLPVLHFGALPVFADVDPANCGLDPKSIESKITPKTKAILLVHFLGLPCKIKEIMALAAAKGLKVIEDASHAHGAMVNRKKVGCFGDIGVFSLQASKLLSAGEGGILVTDDKSLYQRACAYGRYEKLKALGPPFDFYADSGIGTKSRMSALNASLAKSQLRKLDHWNHKFRDRCLYLSERLKKFGLITFSAETETTRVYHKFAVRIPKADFSISASAFAGRLRDLGVPAEGGEFRPAHQMPIFKTNLWKDIARLPHDHPFKIEENLPNTERLIQETVVLPVFHSSSNKTLDNIALAFKKICDDCLASKNQKRFALIGCGNVAALHYRAIEAVGGNLAGVLDITREVKNPPGKKFPGAKFFIDESEFFSWLKQQNKLEPGVDYVAICTPDYKHKPFALSCLAAGSNVICEKPLLCFPSELDEMSKAEQFYGKHIYGVLQSRYYQPVIDLKENLGTILKRNCRGQLKWVALRTSSYEKTWRGDPRKAAGLVMDIGIHSLDLLTWVFGDCHNFEIKSISERTVCAVLNFEKISFDWTLSIGELDNPKEQKHDSRSLSVGEYNMDLSADFTSLHTNVYRAVIEGKGLRISDLSKSLHLAYDIQKRIATTGYINKGGHLFACMDTQA